MKRFLSATLVLFITSFYIFPINLTFFPIANTKQILAVIGILLLGFELISKRNPIINKDILQLSIYAALVSLIGFIATTYNRTSDFTYTTYFLSMAVWLSSAYAVVTIIRRIYGESSIFLIGNCLIGVCVAQCILALAIDLSPPIKAITNAIQGGQGGIERLNRLYGLGAHLDTAGIRFSISLSIIAVFLVKINNTEYQKYSYWYVIAFIIITVLGNMVARTTSVGAVLGLLYLLKASRIQRLYISDIFSQIVKYFIAILAIAVPILIYLYHTNESIHDYLRFAFEGFFSLAETGKWEIDSNERLKTMYVYPNNLKTWIIGDGYMLNPYYSDPYYMGPNFDGYYMGTDVGYLRFIFYFGLIGLGMFMLYFIKATQICIRKFPLEKDIMLLLLAINFIVWFKVSTDCFCIFALYLLVSKEENEKFNKQLS